MKHSVAQSIKTKLIIALKKRDMPFSKKVYRSVKKAYNLVPRNKKKEFTIV